MTPTNLRKDFDVYNQLCKIGSLSSFFKLKWLTRDHFQEVQSNWLNSNDSILLPNKKSMWQTLFKVENSTKCTNKLLHRTALFFCLLCYYQALILFLFKISLYAEHLHIKFSSTRSYIARSKLMYKKWITSFLTNFDHFVRPSCWSLAETHAVQQGPILAINLPHIYID